MAKRKLTAGERALAEAAFEPRQPIAYDKVRLRLGSGANPAAAAAFLKGNPAITLGHTVYLKQRKWSEDYSVAGDASTFIHELAHVWQWERLGRVRFLARYARELAGVRFRPEALYAYGENMPFDGATLEAQAQMLGHYAGAGGTRRQLIADNLKATGFYGL